MFMAFYSPAGQYANAALQYPQANGYNRQYGNALSNSPTLDDSEYMAMNIGIINKGYKRPQKKFVPSLPKVPLPTPKRPSLYS